MGPQTATLDGDQAGAAQQTQVMGDRRLADGQAGDEVAHTHLAWTAGQQIEDLQAHRVR
jgi:hypothetical protein